jgi:hypothetical protein
MLHCYDHERVGRGFRMTGYQDGWVYVVTDVEVVPSNVNRYQSSKVSGTNPYW